MIAEADAAKATFYKHFPFKDDLIVAWINQAEARASAGLPSDAVPEPLTAYVEALIAIARQSQCMGCPYQGSAAEFAEPAHAAAIGGKTRVLASLETRARAPGLSDPRATAEAVFLFLEGIWTSVRMFGDRAPLAHASAAVKRLFV